MGWFSGFFKTFAKSMAKEIIDAALVDVTREVHEEIESHDGTTPEEKDHMKRTLALVVERLNRFVARKL